MYGTGQPGQQPFARAGQGVLRSARLPAIGPGGPLQLAGQCGSPVPTRTAAATYAPPAGSFSARGLSTRRQKALQKAFKRLDPLGYGIAPLEFARDTVLEAPLPSPVPQRLVADLEQIAERRNDGRQVITFAAFQSYYETVGQSISSDGDFEQLLSLHWGGSDVAEIMQSFGRRFMQLGLMQAFPDTAKELNLADFETALRRCGLQPRRDDLQRLSRTFRAREGTINVEMFREQIVAPPLSTSPPPGSYAPSDAPMPLGLAGAGIAQQQQQQQQAVPTREYDVGARPAAIGSSTRPATAMPAPAPMQMPEGRPQDSRASIGSLLGSAAPPRLPGQMSAAGSPQPPPQQPQPPPQKVLAGGASSVTDEDLDAMLNSMESHLHSLRRKQHSAKVGPSGANGVTPAFGRLPTQQEAPEETDDDRIEQQVQQAQAEANQQVNGPVTDADLEGALSSMEEHLHSFKAHKVDPNAKPHWDPATEKVPDPADMPHWTAHQYGHHQVTEPAWKPQAQVSDMYGHQHQASEYGFSNYGAGSHGHHLAHYHLNDYGGPGGLAHHSFKQEEYGKAQFGDAAHHGHWVPHLHGLGTATHHGEHAYKKEEYQGQTYGDKAHHGHWVPHLHGLGGAPPTAKQ